MSNKHRTAFSNVITFWRRDAEPARGTNSPFGVWCVNGNTTNKLTPLVLKPNHFRKIQNLLRLLRLNTKL